MPAPRIDGLAAFGPSPTVVTTDDERLSKVGGYFGRDGLENQIGAGPERSSTVTGILYGSGAAGLAAAEGLLRAFHDGTAHTFTDPLGRAWTQSLVGPLRPEGRAGHTPGGDWFRRYSITVTHLK